MRLKYILLGFTFLLSLDSIAQNYLLKGRVLFEGEPVEFANVYVKVLSKGAVTDSHGGFSIPISETGTFTVQASMVGFQTSQQLVKIPSENTSSLVFTLKEMDGGLDEVVVSGTMQEVSKLDSPVPVEVYSANFFRANPTPSVFESLQNVNGVRPQINCNVCNTGDIHINGLEGPYTMVLIDGMPIVSGLATVYGLTGIPQALIDRVEVVKGPASTLYGSEAVGGLINVITKKPDSAPLVSADVFGTSWGEMNLDLGMRSNWGKNIQSLTGINAFYYDNPIDNNSDGFTDVTLSKRLSFFQKINVKRPENRLFTMAGRYVYEDRWGGEMNWNSEDRGGDEVYGESIYTSRWESFGTWQLPTSEAMNFQFSVNGHNQNSVYGTTLFKADQYIGFGQLTWAKTAEKHGLLLGLAYRYTFYDDNTTATSDLVSDNNQPSKIHLPGAFLQDEIKLTPNQSLLLGIRYDYNSIHGNIFSPRINYKLSSQDKNTTFRLSAGNGFRVANVFTEDHAALTGARDVIFAEELKPEQSWNINVNLVKKIYSDQGTFIGLDGSAFYTYFTNRIVPDYETNSNQIIYSNLDGSAVSKGVSLNLDIAWANGLTITTGGTLMDVSIEEEGVKRRQLLTERFSGVWSVGYEFFRLGLTVDYTGNVYSPMRLPLLGPLDDRPAYSPWYSLQNIQLTKNLGKRWEIYGGVKNLLNFTPPANSIARAFDPFDKDVVFAPNGTVVPTPNNPNGLTFDPTYVFAPNQGIRGFLGVRFTVSE
ncbi:outer membrane receptor for ferrienterochelin and colicins [Algoriphagus locisalis]|uniref:Outer membrane receptor for ferrienterochelin and colicins n=1 Tax=Algoriphagus locisalis TaxID=305507 RepID=A0A1I6YPK2_9BACT|nr:TonB-dependent receptor [Algoriphagus locisalis]SFT52141.1 outer membrane receptor for ferrienterochelin and colicins [Algoriphagus locisalis]